MIFLLALPTEMPALTLHDRRGNTTARGRGDAGARRAWIMTARHAGIMQRRESFMIPAAQVPLGRRPRSARDMQQRADKLVVGLSRACEAGRETSAGGFLQQRRGPTTTPLILEAAFTSRIGAPAPSPTLLRRFASGLLGLAVLRWTKELEAPQRGEHSHDLIELATFPEWRAALRMLVADHPRLRPAA